jgi:hypothetical protein
MSYNLKYPNYRVLNNPQKNLKAIVIQDNTLVKLLTNGFDELSIDNGTRAPVLDYYKQYFNEDDRFNFFIYNHRFSHQLRKWTHVLYQTYFRMAIINVKTLYNCFNPENSLSMYETLRIIAQYLNKK